MLMDIKCSAVPCIRVKLFFDDNATKDEIISYDDLIDVTYNGNGMRKHIIGRVRCISTVGVDPKQWYIIVDGSDDFASETAKFSPKAILDLSIIRKSANDQFVRTPVGMEGLPYLRLVNGRLQYSTDGFEWKYVVINEDDVIQAQEGTVMASEQDIVDEQSSYVPDEDIIEESNY